MDTEELTARDRPLVRAVLRASLLLVPEAFADRSPAEYARDPAAMDRLAEAVSSLAGVHIVAAGYGAKVVSPVR
jgi:hypothetical protein